MGVGDSRMRRENKWEEEGRDRDAGSKTKERLTEMHRQRKGEPTARRTTIRTERRQQK